MNLHIRSLIAFLVILSFTTPVLSQERPALKSTLGAKKEEESSYAPWMVWLLALPTAYLLHTIFHCYGDPDYRRRAIRNARNVFGGLGGGGGAALGRGPAVNRINRGYNPFAVLPRDFRFDHRSKKSRQEMDKAVQKVKRSINEVNDNLYEELSETMLQKIAQVSGKSKPAIAILINQLQKRKYANASQLERLRELIRSIIQRGRVTLSFLENNALSIEERLFTENQLLSEEIPLEETLLLRILESTREMGLFLSWESELRDPNQATILRAYLYCFAALETTLKQIQENYNVDESVCDIIAGPDEENIAAVKVYMKICEALRPGVKKIIRDHFGVELDSDKYFIEYISKTKKLIESREVRFSLSEKLRKLEIFYWEQKDKQPKKPEVEVPVHEDTSSEKDYVNSTDALGTQTKRKVKGKVKQSAHEYDESFEHQSKNKGRKENKKPASHKVRQVLTPEQAKDIISKLKKTSSVFDALFASSRFQITHHDVIKLAEHLALFMDEIGISSAQEFLDGVQDHVHPMHHAGTGELLPSNYLDILRMRFVVFGIFPENWEPKTIEDITAYNIYLRQYQNDL